ncbi:MAG: outer membrane beta-barrel protein [Alphaproteobacteria bacterium]|nr:outer membrane beta-barrel protein [Alphaproteobacteria bacterium]
MKQSRRTAAILGSALVLALFATVATAGESGRSGWYVSAAGGLSRMANMGQTGTNRDPTCYPNDSCAGLVLDGYRWVYDLDADQGSAFEVALGYRIDDVRIELSARRQASDLEHRFRSISLLDGSTVPAGPASPYRSHAETSIDALESTTLSINLYRDFALSGTDLTPYLGAGAGVSRAEVTGLYYRNRYSCSTGCDAGPPERFESWQETDLSDTVLSGHLHAGVDYRVDDAFSLGVKVTYSVLQDLEDESGYHVHAIDGLTSTTTISDMSQLSVLFAVTYLFGAFR